MRFKNLLGLLAIGGAVAYAQKRRGGDLSLAGIKNSVRGAIDNVRGQLGNVMGNQSNAGATTRASASDLGSTADVGAGTRSGLGADDYSTGTAGYSSRYGSNGIDRKF
jgi:hypothetical protein